MRLQCCAPDLIFIADKNAPKGIFLGRISRFFVFVLERRLKKNLKSWT
jgi:hypothetical protein